MVGFARAGAEVFDYGNNLRGQAREAGLAEAFDYPRVVPGYIRPLFCEGIGPFRFVALSGGPHDIAVADMALLRAFPTTALSSAGSRWPANGSPSRGCPPASTGSATANAPRRARC